jgi:uncharacterized protein (DUF2384 family)
MKPTISKDTPEQRQDRIERIDEISDLIHDRFNGNEEKVSNWWRSPNPLLANHTPLAFLDMGREAKLLKFVKKSIDEG